MKELIFNLFVYVDDYDIVRELGAITHERDGSDDEKIKFLQHQVERDYRVAKRFRLPDRCIRIQDNRSYRGELTYPVFRKIMHNTIHFSELIEPIYADMGATSLNPLFVITPIVNGHPRIEEVTNF